MKVVLTDGSEFSLERFMSKTTTCHQDAAGLWYVIGKMKMRYGGSTAEDARNFKYFYDRIDSGNSAIDPHTEETVKGKVDRRKYGWAQYSTEILGGKDA